MRLRPALAITTLAALAAIVAGSASAKPAPVKLGSPKIAETAGSQFPAKAYVLSLPKSTKVPTDQVTVLENGQPVTPQDVKYGIERSFDRETFPDGASYSNEYFLDGDTYQGPYTSQGDYNGVTINLVGIGLVVTGIVLATR